jgi:protein TonB
MTTAPVPSAHPGRFPSSADGIRTAALCAVLSVALHGLLLSLRLPVSSPAQSRQSSMSHDEGLRGRVVTLSAPSASPASPSGVGRQTAAKAATHAQRMDTLPSSPPITPQENPLPEGLPAKVGARSGSNVEPTPVAPVATLPRSGNFGDDYVPRPLLSVPPVAREPPVFAPPPGEMLRGRYVGILSLFIDDHGQVQRIVVDEAGLPEVLEQAAREAFMAAQFTPGEIDGTAVKSRVRVEVIFDDAPIPER